MSEKKKILLSGIQPSGRSHIGNYFGAIKQFIEYQKEYDTHIFIANYHTLTTIQDPQVLKENTLNLAIDYLAVGIDPEKTALYLQSDVPEVTELTWIFNTLVTVPYISRAHAFKDKTARGIEASVGLFDYPVLMAADILLPGANVVPVGEDQRQHVEIARNIAEKFNATFGETFTIPQAIIPKEVAVIPGTDGQKMSKSYNNTISLFASDEEIEKAVMNIPTDSKGIGEPKDPEADIVFQLHTLFAEDQLPEIRKGYEEGGLSYADSKKMLIEEIRSFITPLRERREVIANDPRHVIQVLKNGGERAREQAMMKMREVREKVGLTIDSYER